MSYDALTDIGFKFVDGAENASGMKEQAYLVPVSWIETEAVPVTTPAPTTAKTIIAITGNHVLKDDKAPIAVQPLYTKSGSTFGLEGEELSKIAGSTIELFIPQINADVIGSVAAIKNYRFIVLFRRVGQTTGFWQIGSGEMPAKVENAEGGTGVGATAEVGVKITLKAYDFTPYYNYQGELPAPAPSGT
jgi:hypothetical protein